MRNRVQVSVDYAWHEKIQDVLRELKKNRGKIIDFNPEGPGGGNPWMLVRFENAVDALQYLRDRYPDDSVSFSQSRIMKFPA